MPRPASVLIVDPSSEVREVLRTALERSGKQIYEAARADLGLEMVRQVRPDLIVLDLEGDHPNARGDAGKLGDAAEACDTPLVLLATARRQADRLPHGEFVAKPYHYGPLVRRIEELLAGR